MKREELKISAKLLKNNLYEDILSKEISEEFRNYIIKEEAFTYKSRIELITSAIGITSFLVFLVILVAIDLNNIGVYAVILVIILILSFLVHTILPVILNHVILHERIKVLLIDEKELIKIRVDYPEIYDIVENIYDEILEETMPRNFFISILVNVFLEIILEEDGEILKDKIKHRLLILANKNFVVETLNLSEFVSNKSLLDIFNKTIEGIKIGLDGLLVKERNELKYVKNQCTQLHDSILDTEMIIDSLIKVQKDSTLEKRLISDAENLKKQLKDKPLTKYNLKIAKSPKGLNKERTLSTISILDNQIVEIRTKVGTYFALISHLEKEVEKEVRKLELLTDKELEVKIDVLKSTLQMLGKEKNSIPKDEFEAIKSDYYSQLIRTEQALDKRKGVKLKVICPHCQQKNSSISKNCKSCNNILPYCIVCLNSLGIGEKISICPHCNSVAHANHFEKWLENSETCPYCKKIITRKLEIIAMDKISKISS
ncbi:MAG: hypothetical protein EAX90_08150 [Candidatus Heimdallarchaeota archaeon]|nr:hypothetical protein [Candidatus Heimdallarchaeota archaeon]